VVSGQSPKFVAQNDMRCPSSVDTLPRPVPSIVQNLHSDDIFEKLASESLALLGASLILLLTNFNSYGNMFASKSARKIFCKYCLKKAVAVPHLDIWATVTDTKNDPNAH
jgi:hypothetical protein